MSEMILALLESASNNFNIATTKVDYYLEAVDRQFEINKTEAELRIMKESGTDEDLAFLIEAAEGSVVDSILKAIEKIKQAIIKFFSDIKNTIIEKFSKDNFNDKIDKLEKKVKFLPLLGKKQVIIEDTEKEEKIYRKAMSKFSALKAKLKSGQKVESDEIYEVEEEYSSESTKNAGIASGIKTTLSKAISTVKGMVSAHPKKIGEAEKEASSTMDDMSKIAKDKPEIAANAEKLCRAVASVVKNFVHRITAAISSTISAIKGAVGRTGKDDSVTEASASGNMSGEEAMKIDTGAPSEKADIENSDTAEIKEFCDDENDPIDDVNPDVADDVDGAIDPWDAVMQSIEDIDLDDDIDEGRCKGECGEGCKSECGTACESFMNDSDLDALYNEIMEATKDDDLSVSTNGLKEGPDNDVLVSDLFKDVLASAKDTKKETSVYESLQERINNLF